MHNPGINRRGQNDQSLLAESVCQASSIAQIKLDGLPNWKKRDEFEKISANDIWRVDS